MTTNEKLNNEIIAKVIQKAKKRNIPLESLKTYKGTYYYPQQRVKESQTPYYINDCNNLWLYFIPENEKWCYGYDFSFYDDKNRCYKESLLAQPMKNKLYDTWSDAVTAGLYAFASFMGKCLKKIDEDPDFFSYLDCFG